jgi:hypothetical protein
MCLVVSLTLLKLYLRVSAQSTLKPRCAQQLVC